MGNKAVELMDSLLMSAIPRLRPTHLWADHMCNFLVLVILPQLPPTTTQADSQPVQGFSTGAYDLTMATVTTAQASYATQSAYGTQPA